MQPINKAKTRLSLLQQEIERRGVRAALLTHSRDVFYYTGTARPAYLAVTATGYRLFVKRALEMAVQESGLDADAIGKLATFEDILHWLADNGVTAGSIGLTLDVIPAQAYLNVQRALGPGWLVTNIADLVLWQRMVKDEDEVACIRRACEIVHQGHLAVVENLREGMTELELAALVEDAQRRHFHEGTIFVRQVDFSFGRGPLASGENLLRFSGFAHTVTGIGLSSALPAGPSRRTIRHGDAIVIDIPASCGGYHCDQSRTYVLGMAPAEVRSGYDRLKDIADFTFSQLRSGTTCSSVFRATHEYAVRLGTRETFLACGNERADFVGHGVGLEINEPPLLCERDGTALPENSVVAIEMHLSDPRWGTVKLEDTVLVRRDGAEFLTVTPRELLIV